VAGLRARFDHDFHFHQDDLNLEGPVMENINRAGYDKPTPVQKHALPIGNLSFSSFFALVMCVYFAPFFWCLQGA
jgi:hypothetical protein